MCVLGARHVADLIELRHGLLACTLEFFLGECRAELAAARPAQCLGTSDKAGVGSREERVCTETVCTVVLMIALARSHESRNVRVVVAVDPDTAHRVMYGREDLHRHLARILTDELRVHLENAAKLALEVIRRDMGEVEVNAALIVDAEPHVDADLEDCTRCDVARDEVAVCRIHLLEEIPGLAVLVRPDASALTAAGLGHQTVLIRSRNRRRMNLNELRVADMCTLLIGGGNS